MKLCITLTSLVALALAVSAACYHNAAAGHGEATLRATLSGLREVPPNTSRATATLRASYDETRQLMSFTLEYRNLTANPTAAHIHFAQPRVNGGVIAFLCGGGGKPACPAATSGKITGTIAPADIVGPPEQGINPGDFAGLSYALRTGNAYANIHSPTFPNGEVRGQIATSGLGRAEDQGSAED